MKIAEQHQVNEQQAAAAFSRQSAIFDALYSNNTIVQYKRDRVRSHALRYLPADAHILELNSGTGEDAVFFARQGYRVHATDIAPGMQATLRAKADAQGLGNMISTELCSFTHLDQLQQRGPYDMIFSNFAGLNCTGELDKVLASFQGLLKPGGTVLLVVLPPFCLWETLLVFKGKCRTAFRRFCSSRGRKAKVEGLPFTCWYYKPSFITKALREQYTLNRLEGLCALVPPSYIEGFAERYPRLYRWLVKAENSWCEKAPWKYSGDYYIISFTKK